MSTPLPKNHTDLKIIKLLNTTKEFLKHNPNIIFTRADKGNITVALNKIEYTNKINEMLQDIDTYNPINKDPTKNSLTTSVCYSQDGKPKVIYPIPHTVQFIAVTATYREPMEYQKSISRAILLE